MLYVYLDNNDYVYGYGSDPIGEKYFQADSIPFDVSEHLECYQYIDGEYIADNARLEHLQNMRSGERELFTLEEWFTWYDAQFVQYQRAQRLGIEFDRDMAELDAEAVKNAARITELRKILETPLSAIVGGGDE